MPRPLRLYVAGPLRADSDEQHYQNRNAAAMVAIRLWRKGHHVFCPHSNSGGYLNMLRADVPDKAFRDFGLWLIQHMDGLVLVKGWEQSEGTKAEVAEAERLCIPVYKDLASVPEAPRQEQGELL